MTAKRFDLVDALRGLAIVGIILIHNIEHFNIYLFPDKASLSPFFLKMDKLVWDTVFFLIANKTYSIFALLFGFTFHIQYSRQQEEGKDFGLRFLWRMLLLLGFGWINAILFPGEILVMYALLSPILFLVRKLNDKQLLAVAIFLLLQPYLLYVFFNAWFVPDYVMPCYQGDWGL